ncbi:hypothetical protein [Pseudohalioglobus sediminis]|uniref:hypothetical protein n=1 Tax=Pseudohalioglobus sediminis TaxID=2606449 RepID=UPI00165EF98D|nr:hypothetical protein [Pseudohalioglobus sediminis]
MMTQPQAETQLSGPVTLAGYLLSILLEYARISVTYVMVPPLFRGASPLPPTPPLITQ